MSSPSQVTPGNYPFHVLRLRPPSNLPTWASANASHGLSFAARVCVGQESQKRHDPCTGGNLPKNADSQRALPACLLSGAGTSSGGAWCASRRDCQGPGLRLSRRQRTRRRQRVVFRGPQDGVGVPWVLPLNNPHKEGGHPTPPQKNRGET